MDTQYPTFTLLTDTLSTFVGCDSVVTHHIIVNHPVYTTVTGAACESYAWNGETYTISGDYDQTFAAVNGCDSVVTLHLTITVGIDNHDTFDFKVYPNPTTGVVNVQITNQNSTITEFRIYDAYGKIIRVVDGVGANNYSSMQTAQIDLSGLANGVYFVKAVVDGNTIAARKVIKNQ